MTAAVRPRFNRHEYPRLNLKSRASSLSRKSFLSPARSRWGKGSDIPQFVG